MIDHHDPVLSERLESYRVDREGRADRMAEALRELGYELDDAPLRARAAEGKSIGRPHLARAAVSHPANQARLKEEGLADPSAFLVEYLIEGKPAFRSRTIPSVPESIDAIHEAGGSRSGHTRSGRSPRPTLCSRCSTTSAGRESTASSAST